MGARIARHLGHCRGHRPKRNGLVECGSTVDTWPSPAVVELKPNSYLPARFGTVHSLLYRNGRRLRTRPDRRSRVTFDLASRRHRDVTE